MVFERAAVAQRDVHIGDRGGRREPDELRPADLRVARDGGHDHSRGRARRILHVGRDLHEPGRGQLQPERPHARQPLLPARADQRGDPLGLVERGGRRELDVERDQRRAGRDERGARGGVSSLRAVVGGELVERAGPPQRALARARPRVRRTGRRAARGRRRAGGRAAAPRRTPPRALPRCGARSGRRRARPRAGAPRCARSGRSARSRRGRPRRALRCNSPGSPASVKTARW